MRGSPTTDELRQHRFQLVATALVTIGGGELGKEQAVHQSQHGVGHLARGLDTLGCQSPLDATADAIGAGGEESAQLGPAVPRGMNTMPVLLPVRPKVLRVT